MKNKYFGLAIVLGIIFLTHCAAKDDYPVLKGEYLGQPPPGLEAELFAPGVMSTEMPELNAVFFPGGKEVIGSVTVGSMKWAMLMLREENGRWTKPEIAPFSGPHGGVDPFVTADGKRIYFCSNRPRSGSGEPEEDYDIWYVDRTETGWSDPVNMGPPINSDTHEFYPSLTEDGTFYFQSRREGGIGASDIWKAELVDGKYVEAVPLPEPINSPDFEGDAFIAPDESYIIVSTYRAEKNFGGPDLYISFRSSTGSWGPLINMGKSVNSNSGENCQMLSPCGQYLFFTSRRVKDKGPDFPLSYEAIQKAWNSPQNGLGDIYWVDARIIDQLEKDIQQ
jgi:hypothetical protein